MKPRSPRVLVGVDTGGTFTDFVTRRNDEVITAKVASTPDDPSAAILRGLASLGLEGQPLDLVHGTTVGTNAVLQGRLARVALITNHGFADLLTLGRQNRAALYQLEQPPVPPPVPPDHCLEGGGRVDARGELIEAPSPSDLRRLAGRIAALQPDAVAVTLLFSYLRPDLEQCVADALPRGLPVSLSSRVLPEIREYERGMATWLNAAAGPVLDRYLRRLGQALPGCSIAVMQSDGTTVAVEQAASKAVRLLLSGPAGGLAAAGTIGREAGQSALLTFDMGGTSTDVALIEGEAALTRAGRIAGYPVAVPMVDIHTIGAGGGSLARVDPGGLLHVGPESAGADPGPACYGRGGRQVTVTDAHVYLGRIPPEARLGGDMALDIAACRRAVEALASRLGKPPGEAAAGVIALANEHMSRALKRMSAERGADPARLCLMSFGGAGGLHVCELAERLGMQRALVPARAGVLSALGMLMAEPGRHLTRSLLARAGECDARALDQAFGEMERDACRELVAEGVAEAEIAMRRGVECRYQGQDATLLLPAAAPAALQRDFGARHEQQFGFRMDLPVELVNLRLEARGPRRLAAALPAPPEPRATGAAADGVPVRLRHELGAGVPGPLIIPDGDATTWVTPGWRARCTAAGHLLLERGGRDCVQSGFRV